MTTFLISFLVLLNPFALFIYLRNVMDELSRKDFLIVLLNSSLMSLTIFIIFALTGTFIFQKLFSISFESFRIFGGIVLITFALSFIVQGKRSFITLKGSLDDLASEIALPFMVGAATVSLSVIIGEALSPLQTVLILVFSIFINYLTIWGLMKIRYDILKKKSRLAFDKSLVIVLRLNGFFVGAIGVDMIFKALNNMRLM